MLFFLFTHEELAETFDRFGYAYDTDTARKNIAYYDQRTSHGSTLSFVTFAGVLAEYDPPSSWDRFLVALRSDVSDVQGGTMQEGIHMGVMSGTLDLVQRAYTGTIIRDETLYFRPRLPRQLERLRFSMQLQGTPLVVEFADCRLTLSAHPEGAGRPIRVGIGDDVRELCPGERCTFALASGPDLVHD
jgi:trehalose/maltose hydrolase-like predicted phosphorylase